jgi:hypothetical protein
MSSGKVRQERKPPTSYQNMTSINEKWKFDMNS